MCIRQKTENNLEVIFILTSMPKKFPIFLFLYRSILFSSRQNDILARLYGRKITLYHTKISHCDSEN